MLPLSFGILTQCLASLLSLSAPVLGPHPAECIPNWPENSPTQMFMGWRMLTHGWALLHGSVF